MKEFFNKPDSGFEGKSWGLGWSAEVEKEMESASQAVGCQVTQGTGEPFQKRKRPSRKKLLGHV